MFPLLISPLRIVSLTRRLRSAVSHYGSVILCLALTQLPAAGFTQRRVRRSIEWSASSAYTEDGGGLAIREEYFFGGAEMPHVILSCSLRNTNDEDRTRWATSGAGRLFKAKWLCPFGRHHLTKISLLSVSRSSRKSIQTDTHESSTHRLGERIAHLLAGTLIPWQSSL